jgi:nucleotide-binding universal stress UspA family protein
MTNPTTTSQKAYRIVVGFDFSELAERAVEEACSIAAKSAPAELHVLTVAQQAGDLVRLPGTTEPQAEDAARETVRVKIGQIVVEYQRRRGPIGVERIAVYVLAGLPAQEPAKGITGLASALDANVIVVGTHGRPALSRLLLGSVARDVVSEATTNVYVVRPADFVGGERVPAIEPPLRPGEPHLKHFEHRRTYHYVDKVAQWTDRTLPVS